MMKSSKVQITVLLVIAIIIVVNLLADQFYFRLDFTEDKQYTLSKATKDILKEIQEPVTVKAFFSKDLPPQLIKNKKDFQDMLVEYGRISNHNLVFEFINPNADEQTEMEAMQQGVQPLMINVREKDQMKQQKVYMGAVLSLGNANEVIPVIEPGAAMEYALSTSIKKLSVMDKPSVGLLQGHGEPGINEMIQVATELSILYSFEPLNVTDSTIIPARIKTIAIVRPTDSIPGFVFQQLDYFLARGGRLFIAMNRVAGDLQSGYGSSLPTGLEGWLLGKGLMVNDSYVIDASCVNATMQQQVGNAIHISQVMVPYIPIINNFADHPITDGLEAVVMQFTSPLNFTGDTNLTYTPLVMTSERSAIQPAPQYFNFQKQWTERDFPMQNLVIGAALEGSFAGGIPSKLVVIADGDFPVNGARGQQQQLQEDNVSLMVNSIDWLSDDTGLISLRTKGVSSRPIKELEDSKRTFIKWLNFLLPILLILIYGFIRSQIRRNQRIARMEANLS
jgi:gliding-associated putative ABC transporter substrate-binding component GldG